MDNITYAGHRPRFFNLCDDDTHHGRYRAGGNWTPNAQPKQAAIKAFQQFIRNKELDGISTDGEHKFSIIECTRGSERKIYHYIGERVTLPQPITANLGGKMVTYKYRNRVTRDREPFGG